MTVTEQIQQIATRLPPEKQVEVLDFIIALQKKMQLASELPSDTERRQNIQESSDIDDPVEWQKNIR